MLRRPLNAFLFGMWFFSSSINLHSQDHGLSKFDFALSAGYQFLQPVFSNQSTQILGPMNSINKGGWGFLSSISLSRDVKKWYLNSTLDLAFYKISEIFVINENGQNSEISMNHKIPFLIPEFGMGRYFVLGNGIKTSIELGVGYSIFIGKSDLSHSVQIYDAFKNVNNYYEYDISYSRENPIIGSIKGTLCFPLQKNQLIFKTMFTFSSPITSEIAMERVVGFDFEKIFDDQTYLFFRTFSIVLCYKFTNSNN